MSSEALFSNNPTRGGTKTLVEFKAGKMTMKGKMVYPDTRKGQLYVYQSDDSLMHFCWKDRTTGVVEDDLIIFPDDCEFKHVPQCKTGRVYLLRFESSNKKFFVWLQDLKTDKDEEHCRKINEVLNNPPTLGSQRSGSANTEGDLQNLLSNMSQQQLMQLFGGVGHIGGLGSLLGTMNRPRGVQTAKASTTTASTPVTTSVTRPATTQTSAPSTATESPKPSSNKTTTRTTAQTTPATGSNKIQLSDLQNFLSGIPTPAGAEPANQRGVASELTQAIPAAVASLSLEGRLWVAVHLPPGEDISTALSSPQFAQALTMFWSALQSGQAGPVVRQFGHGPEAVTAAASGNIEEFVNALEAEAKAQPEQQPEEKAPGPQESGNDKKDDDDEGMALD